MTFLIPIAIGLAGAFWAIESGYEPSDWEFWLTLAVVIFLVLSVSYAS